MSTAIMALVQWDHKPVDPQILAAANQTVRHRCPDGAWAWTQGHVGLAQADLTTLPEDKAGVPATASTCHIVASCRLDNREELYRRIDPHLLSPMPSDGELILAAYHCWKMECVQHLVGDYAFVIWDEAEQLLFAARDLAGARALYYYADQQRLALASEHTQILQDPTIPLVVDEEQVAEFLLPSYQWTMGWNLGMLRNFKALPAGHTLVAQDGEIRIQSFWSWPEQKIARGCASDLRAEYRQLLQDAIRSRLRSKTPVAMELSGGLDSTALVALAARESYPAHRELHTLSAVFASVPETDERSRIEALLASLPTEHCHAHLLDASTLFAPLCLTEQWQPRSIVEPQRLLATAAQTQLCQIAHQHGCRVIISGEMGDALNDGSPLVHYDLLRRGLWGKSVQRLLTDWRTSRRRALRNYFYHGLLPFLPWFALAPLLQRRANARPTALPDYFQPQFSKLLGERDAAVRQAKSTQWPIPSPAIRSLLAEFLPPMPIIGAPQTVAMEYRYPYTDRRLFEFLLRLPPEMKWEAGVEHPFAASRLHHREAMADIIPDAVRCNNIGVYFDPAIANSLSAAKVRAWLQSAPQIHIAERGYVNQRKLIDCLMEGDGISGYMSTMLCLEAWLRALSPGGKMHQLVPVRHIP
ncbi:MAG: asparagine synthase-related protein [Caldilineaceae bacterium]